MPFRSQAQRGYLFANHPQVAKEFAAATPKGAQLPMHVGGAPIQHSPNQHPFGNPNASYGGDSMTAAMPKYPSISKLFR